MSALELTREEQEALVSANHATPRSILGYHEIPRDDAPPLVIIRVLEPDAETVEVFWEDEDLRRARPLEKLHAGGLFQGTIEYRRPLVPYLLHVRYYDGQELTKHDPYYFSPQLSELDLYLFGEGNHHRIYYKLGAHPEKQDGVAGTRFAVWAPTAKRVSVVGDFNFWDGRKHAMQARGSSGIWELFVPGVKAGANYKYEIRTGAGTTLLKADPYGFQMQLRPENCSVVADLSSYEWGDQDWMERRARSDPHAGPVSIYEVHLGSWRRDSNEPNRFLTYDELADQLIPHVEDLGYTHIELVGVAEHPYDASWGYQVVGYYAPTSRFGTPQDFRRFIDRCHQAGIGVIMDWVPAHFPKDEHGLVQFDGSALYEHEDPRQGEHMDWGTKIFNFGRKEVRNFLVANALFWFEQYHIDGIRVDAVASMLYLDYSRKPGEWVPNKFGGRENLDAIDFLKQLNGAVFHYYPGVLSIAEESTAFPAVSHPTYVGGLGFNMKWNMGWMNDTLRYMATDPIYRKYDHHLITFSLMYAFSEHFVLPLSHDEVVHGKGSLLAKMPGDDWQQRANYRLLLAYMTAHPGKKLLFMGSEFGQWEEWKEYQSLDWHLLEDVRHRELQDFNRALNHFYRAHPALYSIDFDAAGFEWIDLHNHDQSVYSFLRNASEDTFEPPVIFVFNFTPIPRDGYCIGVPSPGSYVKIFDSDETRFGGSGYNHQGQIESEGITWHERAYRVAVDLPPLAMLAFQLDNRA